MQKYKNIKIQKYKTTKVQKYKNSKNDKNQKNTQNMQSSQSDQIHNPENTNRHPFSNPQKTSKVSNWTEKLWLHKKGGLRYQHLTQKTQKYYNILHSQLGQ